MSNVKAKTLNLLRKSWTSAGLNQEGFKLLAELRQPIHI